MRGMSSDDKAKMYKAAKQCNFFCLFLVCTTAWIMSLYATAFCAFVDRSVNFQAQDNVDSVCATLSIPEDQCVSILGEHGVGFWAWEITVPEDQQVCFSYTQYVNGVGYVTPEFDTMFNTARASMIVAVFFGALAWFTMALFSCCPLNQASIKCLAFYFFISGFFQGLGFLIFKSDICDIGFFSAFFDGGTIPDGILSVSCSRNMATNMAIAATVLYFFAMLMVPGATAPPPMLTFSGAAEEKEQEEEEEVVESKEAASEDA